MTEHATERTAYPYGYGNEDGGMHLRKVVGRTEYHALPYETHPIDLIDHPNGWGWKLGPWMPVQYENPADGISIAWSGANDVMISPPYDVTTLFDDPSTARVANVSLFAALTDAVKSAARRTSATIGNRGQGSV